MGARGLTKMVIVLFGATALLVTGMFAALLISVVKLRDDDSRAQRSSDLLAQSFVAERSVIDLETGLRGFLLTRQTRFLAPYTQARTRLPDEMAALRRLATTPMEREQIDRLTRGVRSYIDAYATPLVTTAGRLTSARRAQATVRGKRQVDTLRVGFTELNANELARRTHQRSNVTTGAATAVKIAGLGLVASVLLLFAELMYVIFRVLRPITTVSAAAERLAQGELDARVPEVGVGEVARLADDFNAMAGAIESRDRELTDARTRLEQAVEEANEASAMKSNFLANMSHEVRTPLNGVIGMMNLLADTPLTTEQAEYVDAARSSGDALMTVVNDILDIAKIEAGRLELEERDFDLRDMVESTCDMVAAGAMSKGLELQSFVHDDVPSALRGDRMRVSQILANLLSNAVKFTAVGEVALEVTVARREEPGTAIRFEVRDTGIGIPHEKIDELFEPFSQADAGTTRQFGGTGLGLTISLELARLMGGRITVQSELGKGSSFQVTLPFAAAHEQVRAPMPVAGLRGLHVLVVDDNATNRRVFEAYVVSWGMRADVARNAEEALARLRGAARKGDPFDLVLLDFNMPGESGLELARKITRSAQLRRTRMIMLTSSSHAGTDDPTTGIRYQLTKPVRQSRLLDTISLAMAQDGPELELPDLQAPLEEEAPAVGPATIPTGSRILVAEDQDVNWMLIERMLGKRGHAAMHATDGSKAIDLLDQGDYDLVLMDCQMPIIDGYEATRQIREREGSAGLGHVPIVAMTANAMSGERERCLEAGMDDYLPKPISNERLDSVLERWLPRPENGMGKLDNARVEELRSLFPGDELQKILAELSADVSAHLDRIEASLSGDDPATAAQAAHRIINSALMLGAQGLVQAARRTERLAHEHTNGDGEMLEAVRALRDSWKATQAAMHLEFVP